MGIYLYRLNKPKKVAGEMIGTMKYWDKVSFCYGREGRRHVMPDNNLEAHQCYARSDTGKPEHGTSIVMDMEGGYNYWEDADEGRFEDTGRILIKYGHRWEIIHSNDYIHCRVWTDREEIFDVRHGVCLYNSREDWNSPYDGAWTPVTQAQMDRLYKKYLEYVDDGNDVTAIDRVLNAMNWDLIKQSA